MIYTKIINMNYNELLKKFEKEIIEIKFGILAKIDIPSRLKEKGLIYDEEFTIFEICNPNKAKEVLDIEFEVVHFLPCKIVVRKSGDKSSVSFVRPTSQVEFLNNGTLNDIAKDMEQTIINFIEKLAD